MIVITTFPSFLLQGEFGSGLHRVNRGAGTAPGAELQADGDPEEGLTGAGQSGLVSIADMQNTVYLTV